MSLFNYCVSALSVVKVNQFLLNVHQNENFGHTCIIMVELWLIICACQNWSSVLERIVLASSSGPNERWADGRYRESHVGLGRAHVLAAQGSIRPIVPFVNYGLNQLWHPVLSLCWKLTRNTVMVILWSYFIFAFDQTQGHGLVWRSVRRQFHYSFH